MPISSECDHSHAYHCTELHLLQNICCPRVNLVVVNNQYDYLLVHVLSICFLVQIMADGVDPRLQTFFWCSKPHKRRRLKNQVQNATMFFCISWSRAHPIFSVKHTRDFWKRMMVLILF
ncbi:hypothetical protein CK203_009226 [Vitis vinifera]|uniref:Uncharacterized protein n=1 Tax=Vitis vinifera TaxID=29760 RepID=A0A438K2K2_VITVI|nr:hypothetical protein CK203_009226 [Vitis vinifera]